MATPAPVATGENIFRIPEENYPYVVVEQRLTDVLRAFGANLGIPMAVGDSVKGVIRGPWPEMTAAAFLRRLESTYRLQSYFDGEVLHVTSVDEARSEMLRLNGVAFPDLVAELDSLALLDRNYSLRAAPNGLAALVYGPPRYLELVKQTLLVLGERSPDAAPPVRHRRPTEVFRGYTAEAQ